MLTAVMTPPLLLGTEGAASWLARWGMHGLQQQGQLHMGPARHGSRQQCIAASTGCHRGVLKRVCGQHRVAG